MNVHHPLSGPTARLPRDQALVSESALKANSDPRRRGASTSGRREASRPRSHSRADCKGPGLGSTLWPDEGASNFSHRFQPAQAQRLLRRETAGANDKELPLVGVAVIGGFGNKAIPGEYVNVSRSAGFCRPDCPSRIKPTGS